MLVMFKDLNPKEKAKLLLGSDIEYIGKGSQAEIYGNKDFVIKIFFKPLKPKYSDKLWLLSDAKLIPKIHEIGEDYVIMDRVHAQPLVWKYIKVLTKKQKEIIYQKIKNLMENITIMKLFMEI